MILSPEINAYLDVANAIVRQAADDYRSALKGNKIEGKSPEDVIEEVEKFFRSEWYRTLTKVDGEYLLKALREEHLENMRKEQLCESN